MALYQILIPSDDTTGWHVASRDSTYPVERDQLTVNGQTGEVTASFDYSTEHWFSKLRTSGIILHQAQMFGRPLQVVMTFSTLSVAHLVILGYRMWWPRRPKGGLGVPAPIRGWAGRAPIAVLAAVVVVAYLLPVLALSVAIWLVLESGWRWVVPTAQDDPVSQRDRLARAGAGAGFAALGLAMLARPDLGAWVENPPRSTGWASGLVDSGRSDLGDRRSYRAGNRLALAPGARSR